MNDFYTFKQLAQEENNVTGEISFHKEHDIFKGHFPGQPVVPGVCMMEIVKEILQNATNTRLRLITAAQVKFLRLILPDVTLRISLSWTYDGAVIAINSVWTDGAPVFKMISQYHER